MTLRTLIRYCYVHGAPVLLLACAFGRSERTIYRYTRDLR